MEDERNVTSDERERVAGVLTRLANDYAARAKTAADAPERAGIRITAPHLADVADNLNRAVLLIQRLSDENERMREGLGAIREHILHDDHRRGCDGRNYTCECGYDATTISLAEACPPSNPPGPTP